LVVDDFGVKYQGKEHAKHLMNALKETYETSEDWEGENTLDLRLIGIMMEGRYTSPCQDT
jgi:hypothetical protein